MITIIDIRPFVEPYIDDLELGESFGYSLEDSMELIIEFIGHYYWDDLIFHARFQSFQNCCFDQWGLCDEFEIYISTIELLIELISDWLYTKELPVIFTTIAFSRTTFYLKH